MIGSEGHDIQEDDGIGIARLRVRDRAAKGGRRRAIQQTLLSRHGICGFGRRGLDHGGADLFRLQTWEFEGAQRRYSDRFSGYSLFVSRGNPFPGESLQCASAIGANLQAAGYHPSNYHAEAIDGENRPFADRLNGVHYYDQLVVLHTARQPAVLIEAGVIVNREAEQVLAVRETRENIAHAIAAGVAACLSRRTEAQ